EVVARVGLATELRRVEDEARRDARAAGYHDVEHARAVRQPGPARGSGQKPARLPPLRVPDDGLALRRAEGDVLAVRTGGAPRHERVARTGVGHRGWLGNLAAQLD